MLTLAAETATNEEPPTSMIVLLIVLMTGGIIYLLGYRRAVMHRANRDYKTTKAALPGMRKGFWRTWWDVVKIGFFVLLGIGILIFWAGSDLRNDGDKTPTPAQVTPAPKRT